MDESEQGYGALPEAADATVSISEGRAKQADHPRPNRDPQQQLAAAMPSRAREVGASAADGGRIPEPSAGGFNLSGTQLDAPPRRLLSLFGGDDARDSLQQRPASPLHGVPIGVLVERDAAAAASPRKLPGKAPGKPRKGLGLGLGRVSNSVAVLKARGGNPSRRAPIPTERQAPLTAGGRTAQSGLQARRLDRPNSPPSSTSHPPGVERRGDEYGEDEGGRGGGGARGVMARPPISISSDVAAASAVVAPPCSSSCTCT